MNYDYENLLENAYQNVRPCNFCDRFEVKKVEGRHEGNKTILTNFSQIVNCLRRDEFHLSKFLFRELATTGYTEGERLILNGKITSSVINDKIKKYVENFVKCPKCGKPDTEIITEDTQDYLRCLACCAKIKITKI